ncbi:unnamed protein product [Cyclocybe aegerita]|uniref:BAG domain-containing protein n=1 Tax=Cyclocybe aegerita TaxID=1973307 RepID=A0A8S0WH62_CYCAE|nr:unnamed protein product [Cyclocybe aegerita]
MTEEIMKNARRTAGVCALAKLDHGFLDGKRDLFPNTAIPSHKPHQFLHLITMFGQPWYTNNAPEASYNPFSAYYRPSPYQRSPARNSWSQWADEQAERAEQERALNNMRARAEQHARRAQWLPDEEDISDEDSEYSQLGPRQRAYLEAVRRQEAMERLRAEEEARRERLFEEQRRQMEEEQEARQRLLEERRKQFQERREEEARRLSEAFEREMQSRLHQQQARSSSRTPPSQDNIRVPIPTRFTHFTASSRAPSPKQVYGEEHEEAASRIQRQFRIHQSYRALHALSSQFEELKRNFVYPSSIDFQKPGAEEGHITVAAAHVSADFEVLDDSITDAEASMNVDSDSPLEAKLAYTSTNYPIHQYADQMDQILMKLDGVESWGEKDVRTGRKKIVKEIEEESAKLERYWKQAWRAHIEEAKAKEHQEEPMGAKKDIVEVEMATPALEDSLPAPVDATSISPTEAKSKSESTPAHALPPPSNPANPTNADSSSNTISEETPRSLEEQQQREVREQEEESESEDLVTIPADIDEDAWALDEVVADQSQAVSQAAKSKEDSDVQMAGDEWVDVGKTEF